MTQTKNSRLFSILGTVRLIASTGLLLYASLTLMPLWWNEGVLYNLAATEDNARVCIVSFLLLLLPGISFLPLSRFTRWIPLLALLLFMLPAVQSALAFSNLEASSAPGCRSSFSWGSWIKGYQPAVTEETLEMTAANGQKLQALAYTKNGQTEKRFAVIVLHGGGFTTGAAQHGKSLAAALADHGWLAISAEYRLAPQTQYPGQVQDVQAWIQFLKSNSARWAIDTSCFFLAGESAGATIALNAAYTLQNSNICAVANLYGICDAGASQSEPSITDVTAMLDAYRGSEVFESISPVAQASVSGLPTISIHGKRDPIISWKHASLLSTTLDRAQIENQLVLLPWATHLFNHPAYGPSGQLAVEYIDRFFRRQLQ